MAGRARGRQSEDGTDLERDALFRVLHAEHEQVDALLTKILARPDDGEQGAELWSQVAPALLLHARAENQAVYPQLEEVDELGEEMSDALSEHDQIEAMLLEAHRLRPGSRPFVDKVTELAELVRHHVKDEETEILPQAAELLPEADRKALADAFQQAKRELEAEVQDALGPEGGRRRRAAGADDRSRSQRSEAKAPRGRAGRDGLDQRTVKELQALARERGIEGRSKMNKDQLRKALEG